MFFKKYFVLERERGRASHNDEASDHCSGPVLSTKRFLIKPLGSQGNGRFETPLDFNVHDNCLTEIGE